MRPAAAVEAILTFGSVALVAAVAYRFKDVAVELFHNIFGGIIVPAHAATTPSISSVLNPVQLYIIIGFAVLIAIGFVWFAATATLSREAATRRAAMDMTKNVMLFMMGLVTGYLSGRP